jgi:TonB family protein
MPRSAAPALLALLLSAVPAAAQTSDLLRPQPPAHEVADVEALRVALRRVTGPQAGPMMLRAHFDARGRPDSAASVFPALPAEFTAPLREAVLRHLKTQTAAAAVHLLVRGGESATVRTHQVQSVTQPELANAHAIAQRMGRARQRMRARFVSRGNVIADPRQAVISGVAATDGSLVEPVLAVSTGDPVLDREALQVAAHARFTPGRVAGAAVAMPVRLPLTFQDPRRGSRP